jgi:signal transduction histidine kinase
VGRLTVRRRSTLVLVALVGAMVTAGAAVNAAMQVGDVLSLLGLAAATTLVGAVSALVALNVSRSRTIGGHVLVIAVFTVVSVAAGAVLGARTMFISAHDLDVLVVILCAATTTGVLGALVVAERVGRASTALVDATRRLGTGEPRPPDDDAQRTAETARLARELDRTARRLHEAQCRERAAEASRRELVAYVSHDLRTPLAAARAVVEALADGVIDDDLPRYYATLACEIDRLSTLVDELFELSRTQRGVLRLEYERVALGDLVSDVIASLAPLAAAKGVQLRGRFDGADSDGDCDVAPSEMSRALRNVVDNAIRHTRCDGVVVVSASIRDARAVVSVQDDGGGIRAEDLPHLFEAGFRSDRARRADAGAGLGLTIAKAIVEAHSGAIDARNHNGGACVTICWPRLCAGTPAAPPATVTFVD